MSISLTRDGMYTRALWEHSDQQSRINGARRALPAAERTLDRLNAFVASLQPGQVVTARDLLKVGRDSDKLKQLTGTRTYNGIRPNLKREIPRPLLNDVVKLFQRHVADLRNQARQPDPVPPQHPGPVIL